MSKKDVEELTDYPLRTGNVYEDDRTGDEYEVVNLNTDNVVLEYIGDIDYRGRGLHERGQFEQEEHVGRWVLVRVDEDLEALTDGESDSNGEEDPGPSEEPEPAQDDAQTLTDIKPDLQEKIESVIEEYRKQDGRKVAHKAEGLEEVLPICDDTGSVRNLLADYEAESGRIASHKATAIRNALDCIEAERAQLGEQ